MSGIVWLASYPKSGNTWFRAFLTNLWRNTDTPADINALEGSSAISARWLFDEVAGIAASDLTAEEIDALRPRVYVYMAEQSAETLWCKIHDANLPTSVGQPLVPPQVTRGALYFVRNPLDVAVSFAHHEGVEVETIMARMADHAYALSSDARRLHLPLRQRLSSWSGHVRSWLEAAPFPVHLVRYEDMQHCPLPTFCAAARFAGLPSEPARVRQALRLSTFAELQRQERANGFWEKPSSAPSFFRRGQVGTWRDVLTVPQVARLMQAHGEVMRQCGYLTAEGQPVF